MKYLFSTLAFCFSLASICFANDDASELFRKIWSPYCPGVSLAECPSSQAQDLRDEIKGKLEKGESSDAIISEMYQRYGDRLRMQPKIEGRESLAYSLPWVSIFTAAGIVLLFWWMKWRRKIKFMGSESPQTPPDSEMQKRILKDLENRLE